MSFDDDVSFNNDEALIDFTESSVSGGPIRTQAQHLPKIRVKMEKQRVEDIFDDAPYIIKTVPDDSQQGGSDEECESRQAQDCEGTECGSNNDNDDNGHDIGSDSESNDNTEESNDLIDVTPIASVARIKNQTISNRDDDVEGMRKFRNIAGMQSKKASQSRYVPKRRKAKHPHGYLKIVLGSMYSGKSSELRTDRNDWLSIKGIRILVVNFAHDKRYTDEDMVMTHNKEGVKCISVEHLAEITNGECYDETGNVVLPADYDLILIDEGQFYDDLKDNIIHWVDILRKTVFVYGLDGDFRRQQFGQMMDLIPLCDEIIKKKANCMICNNGNDSLFTWKLANNDDEAVTVEIGSNDKYVALCRKHYNRMNKPSVVITGQVYSR